MLRFFVIFLLSTTCVSAGTMKTFDGVEASKDSVAELRVHYHKGRKIDPERVFCFVTAIDTLRLYDRLLQGEDLSSRMGWQSEALLDKILLDAGIAERLKKVFLGRREYRIWIQCVHVNTNIKTGQYSYSVPIELKFTPEPKMIYEICAKLINSKWSVSILESKSKSIVVHTE